MTAFVATGQSRVLSQVGLGTRLHPVSTLEMELWEEDVLTSVDEVKDVVVASVAEGSIRAEEVLETAVSEMSLDVAEVLETEIDASDGEGVVLVASFEEE